jgi:hypothetical protein
MDTTVYGITSWLSLGIYLSISLSIYLNLSVCLSIYLSIVFPSFESFFGAMRDIYEAYVILSKYLSIYLYL